MPWEVKESKSDDSRRVEFSLLNVATGVKIVFDEYGNLMWNVTFDFGERTYDEHGKPVWQGAIDGVKRKQAKADRFDKAKNKIKTKLVELAARFNKAEMLLEQDGFDDYAKDLDDNTKAAAERLGLEADLALRDAMLAPSDDETAIYRKTYEEKARASREALETSEVMAKPKGKPGSWGNKRA